MMMTVRPFADRAHVVLDDALAFVIERAGRLIEDQDARIADEGARDRDALALAAREPAAPLADDRVIALRQLEDELVGAGELSPPRSTRSIGIAGSASAMLSRTDG